jgi:HAD superfamily hydrolase (TIGR01490 family)
MSAQKFAVFDIDGTLIRWQLYHAVVDRLAKNNLLGSNAHNRLHNARMIWKRRENVDAFLSYEKEVIAVYEEALGDLDVKVFDKIVKEIVSEYKSQTYIYTRNLAKKLKAKDYVLLAISGSHQELVKHIAKNYNFDDWVGTEYFREGNRFNGVKKVPSLDKKSVLKNLIKKHNLSTKDSYAIGDSKSDASLLELVENPIAFNPDLKLLAIAKKHRWPIIIERKNVIYKLKAGDNGYVLV